MEALLERPPVVGAFSGDAVDDSALPDQHHLRALEVARQESPVGKIREGRSIDAEIGSGQGLIVRVAHVVNCTASLGPSWDRLSRRAARSQE